MRKPLAPTRAHAVNLAVNPIADAVNVTTWWTPTRVTLAVGAGFLRATITDATLATNAQRISTPNVAANPQRVRVTPGETIRVTGQVRSSASVPMSAVVQFQTATDGFISSVQGVSVATNPTAWTDLPEVSAVAPANADFMLMQVGIFGTGPRAIGNTLDVRHVMIAKGVTSVSYFDGSTPGCYWTGTPNASTSVRPSLPWQQWDGTRPQSLALDGMFDGATVQPVTFAEVEVV